MFRLLLFCALFLLSCQQKQQPQDLVLQLRELNELATIEYSVSKIIKASDDQTWYKIGERKILMSCRALIKAGIDLNQMQASDIQVNGKKISIDLPPAKVLSINIRPEDVKLEYEEVGLFRNEFTAAERNVLMSQGESQIRKQVDATDIKRDAETQASLVLGNFLRSLGFTEVNIRFNHPSLPTPQLNK